MATGGAEQVFNEDIHGEQPLASNMSCSGSPGIGEKSYKGIRTHECALP